MTLATTLAAAMDQHAASPPTMARCGTGSPWTGSPSTSAAAIDRACAFYRSVGKQPLRLDREVNGFLANRMQMVGAQNAVFGKAAVMRNAISL